MHPARIPQSNVVRIKDLLRGLHDIIRDIEHVVGRHLVYCETTRIGAERQTPHKPHDLAWFGHDERTTGHPGASHLVRLFVGHSRAHLVFRFLFGRHRLLRLFRAHAQGLRLRVGLGSHLSAPFPQERHQALARRGQVQQTEERHIRSRGRSQKVARNAVEDERRDDVAERDSADSATTTTDMILKKELLIMMLY